LKIGGRGGTMGKTKDREGETIQRKIKRGEISGELSSLLRGLWLVKAFGKEKSQAGGNGGRLRKRGGGPLIGRSKNCELGPDRTEKEAKGKGDSTKGERRSSSRGIFSPKGTR